MLGRAVLPCITLGDSIGAVGVENGRGVQMSNPPRDLDKVIGVVVGGCRRGLRQRREGVKEGARP